MSLVTVCEVSRAFGQGEATVLALDRVSLRVDQGEMVALIGASGSGKSTLLHLIVGWDRPDGGQIELAGSLGSRRGWTGVAIVPQELGLLSELSAADNIRLALALGGSGSADGLVSSLDLEGLLVRFPDQLSLGEQQRVAVARALVCGPALVVADEPTSHQDERRSDQVMDALRSRAEAGGAVVVATHDVRLLDRVDRVVELSDGRVVPRVG